MRCWHCCPLLLALSTTLVSCNTQEPAVLLDDDSEVSERRISRMNLTVQIPGALGEAGSGTRTDHAAGLTSAA